VVFGGDFCQTLPVVPKGTCQQVVAASLCRGNLWGYIKFLHLRQNMHLGHSEAGNQYAQWLLEIGAGSTMDNNEMIQVPQSMCHDLAKRLSHYLIFFFFFFSFLFLSMDAQDKSDSYGSTGL